MQRGLETRPRWNSCTRSPITSPSCTTTRKDRCINAFARQLSACEQISGFR